MTPVRLIPRGWLRLIPLMGVMVAGLGLASVPASNAIA